MLLVSSTPQPLFGVPDIRFSPENALTGGRHAAGGGGEGRALAASQHGGLEVGVTPGVLDQVVAPHEALVAQGAQEALLPRVGASVAGELVRAGELLLAVRPGAREGPLPCRTHTHTHSVTTSLFGLY